MAISEEKLAELRAANPGVELHVLTNPDTGDEMVAKGPGDGEWKAFLQASEGSSVNKLFAQRELCVRCAVFPTGDDLRSLFAQKPALATTFTGELGEIAGASAKATHRKL